MSEEKKNAEQPSPALGEKLMKTRSIMLTGEITKESADQVIRNLLVMDSEGNDPITIYINSPGGDVDGGFAIYDMIRFISSPVRDIEIHAQNMEHCRQMTDSIIAQACGRSIEEVHRDTERDHWIYSQGAVEYGLISRVITTKDELK